MPAATLTYREPETGLTLSVAFYGAYDDSRPLYHDTATWSRESGNVDLRTTHRGPAEGPQSWHGDCNNLYRALHAFADFLTSDAEAYGSRMHGFAAGDDCYTFDAVVAEHAYDRDSELTELALFLSERERFGELVRSAPYEADDRERGAKLAAYVESLSEEDRAMWDLFTSPSSGAAHMFRRFEYRKHS